jgi:sarcosine dehydrogenase
MLWRLRPADADIELHSYTRDTLRQLEVEQDAVGSAWHENGGLFIANNPERMREYERLAETGKHFGIQSHVLAPDEIHGVHPLVATDDVYAALHSPTDGTIDPTGAVTLFAKAARQVGPAASAGRGCLFEHEAVAAIATEDVATSVASVTGPTTGTGTAVAERTKRVTSVTTASGHTITTPWVVNCAGAWSNSLAHMVGVHLPLLAMKHAMVVTEGIPGMHGGKFVMNI